MFRQVQPYSAGKLETRTAVANFFISKSGMGVHSWPNTCVKNDDGSDCRSRGEIPRTQKLRSPLVGAQGCQKFPVYKPGVDQNIASHAALADSTWISVVMTEALGQCRNDGDHGVSAVMTETWGQCRNDGDMGTVS